ncbi:MFS transporter, partial [Actinomadura adrarensis]
VRGGAFVALLGALAFTRIDAGSAEGWPAFLALVIGVGLGFVGAPTMGSMYRTLPPPLVPQGSSVLYMLNQLGASVGIAAVTLIMDVAGDGDPLAGIRAVAWFAAGSITVILMTAVLLPGRPDPVDVPAAPLSEAAPERERR